MTEQQLATELKELVREPAVPQRLDVARGIADGRRALRRRRLGVSVGAALGVCAVAGGAVALVPADPPPRLADSPPILAEPPAPAPPPVLAPRQFDPLVRSLVVGYVPDGLGERKHQITPEVQDFGAWEPPTESGLVKGLTVIALPAGGTLHGKMGEPQRPGTLGTPTDPVRGRQARCVGTPCSTLLFEYAPGGWVQVRYNGRAGEPAAVVRRVAESVRLDGRERVRMPFTVTGIPAGLAPQESLVTTSTTGRPWEARISWSDYPSGFHPKTRIPRTLGVDVYPDPRRTGDGAKTPDPNTRVDGYPATRTRSEGGDHLEVFDVGGIHFSIGATDADVVRMLGPEGPVGLYRRVRLVPGYTSLDAWTDHPVR
jgi:hypothetical protein